MSEENNISSPETPNTLADSENCHTDSVSEECCIDVDEKNCCANNIKKNNKEKCQEKDVDEDWGADEDYQADVNDEDWYTDNEEEHQSAVMGEWYKQNPALQRAEIQAMLDIKPDAKYGFLSNGKMYWTIRLRPIICGKRKDWTLLMVYDEDHPRNRLNGSVKVYPVKPNWSEMQVLLDKSTVSPKSIPHMLQDANGQLYMCTQPGLCFCFSKSDKVTSAAVHLRFAMRWITVFELGLIDQTTWSKFQAYGEI